jgi:hypothetical protein
LFFYTDLDPLGSEMLRPDRIRILNNLSVSVYETGSDLSDTLICTAYARVIEVPLDFYVQFSVEKGEVLQQLLLLYVPVPKFVIFLLGLVLGSDPDSEYPGCRIRIRNDSFQIHDIVLYELHC